MEETPWKITFRSCPVRLGESFTCTKQGGEKRLCEKQSTLHQEQGIAAAAVRHRETQTAHLPTKDLK